MPHRPTHHTQPSVHSVYLERLHAHVTLIGTLRESLLEALSRPEASEELQSWITTTLERSRLQGRHITRILRSHGEKPHEEHDTVSHLLDTMVSCFPSGDHPPHLLGAVLNLAGYIARLRTSLALLLLLAEKSHHQQDKDTLQELHHNSKEAARTLKNVLPSLLGS